MHGPLRSYTHSVTYWSTENNSETELDILPLVLHTDMLQLIGNIIKGFYGVFMKQPLLMKTLILGT